MKVENIYLFVVEKNYISNSKYINVKKKILFKNDDEKEKFLNFKKSIVILQRTFDAYNYVVNKKILN